MKSRSTFVHIVLVFLILLGAALPVAASPDRSAKKGGSGAVQAAGLSAISIPGTPLQINVYNDGSVGLLENGVVQFFRERASGVFLWAGGEAWGPTVPAGPGLPAFTLVNHGTLLGDGSATNPYRVISTFRVSNTGLLLTQNITYVNGDRSVNFEWTVKNTGTTQPVTLFHAADLYVKGNDAGSGFFDASTQTVGGVNLENRYYGLFTPITPATAYEEADYGTIWRRILLKERGFVDRIVEDEVDNGAGLQ